MWSTREVAAYYEGQTSAYVKYGGNAAGWHSGLWDDTVTSFEEALICSNRILTEGLGLAPGARVLDAGCGAGGLAVFIAETFGAEAVGITICPSHIELCERRAREHGVAHLTTFRCLDFMELDFEDASFDCVLSQEALCHAEDKARYFEGIRRVLKPGGHYAALEGLLGTAPLGEQAREHHLTAQRGWRIPPLSTVAEVLDALARTGFEEAQARDLTSLAAPTSRMMLDATAMIELQKLTGMLPPGVDEDLITHIRAGRSFGRGLLDGFFVYARIHARR